MYRRGNRWGGRLVLLAGIGGACAKALATPPAGPHFAVFLANAAAAPGDTARYIVSITPAPATPSSPAVTSWNVRLLGVDTTRDSTGDYAKALLYRNIGNRTVDTLPIVTPLTFVDSTGPYRVAVRGNNQFGSSLWVKSSAWFVKRKGLPPGPPGILVDSTTLNKLGLVRVVVRPQLVTMTAGTSVQFCAIGVLADSSVGLFAWGRRAGVPAESVRTDTITACLQRLAAYKLERPA